MYSPNSFSNAQRDRFAADRLETASNAQIVTMCYDRLDRDLGEALQAIHDRDHFTANETLRHAQDLIGELAMMLDVAAWEHAGALLSVYDYLLRILAAANIDKSEALVNEAQRLVTELGDGFRGAAKVAGGGMPRHAEPASSDSAATSRWSVQA